MEQPSKVIEIISLIEKLKDEKNERDFKKHEQESTKKQRL